MLCNCIHTYWNCTADNRCVYVLLGLVSSFDVSVIEGIYRVKDIVILLCYKC